MVEIYHINFHTVHSVPIFLDPAFAASLTEIISTIVRDHDIVCHASSVMPNHIHLVVTIFPDQTRAKIVQLLKGGAARAFFELYPAVREEIGAHLWQEGFDWELIADHRQFQNAVRYVQENRGKIGLDA